jgi:hypothetical protein
MRRNLMASFKGQKGINKEEAFWSKVNKGKDHECWEYEEYKDKDGYGRFHLEDGPIGAHVYAWLLSRKLDKIPEGKIVMHLCDNRACCNPAHIICGTHLDNMRDKVGKGRLIPPHISACPSLYSGEIWLVRKLLNSNKFSQATISKMFKVHQSTISHINTSDRWLCKEGGYA